MTFNTDWRNVDKAHFPDEEDGTINATLNSILWSSLATGVNEITESNWEEAWVRIDMWQTLIGPWFTRYAEGDEAGPQPVKTTKEDVHNAIGAHTNASAKSRTRFLADLVTARYSR